MKYHGYKEATKKRKKIKKLTVEKLHSWILITLRLLTNLWKTTMLISKTIQHAKLQKNQKLLIKIPIRELQNELMKPQ